MSPRDPVLYREVKRQLIADIQSGVVGPGDALPNERELARRFNVSIGTLRRAVDELVAEQILLRQQGRGTFVGRQDRDRYMFQFFKIASREGTREFPEVRLHAFSRSRPTVHEARKLGLQTSDPVLRIDNVLALQGRPAIHDHIVISAARFPGLTRQRFAGRGGTIYEQYQSEFGITVIATQERVRAEPASRESAELLDLPVGMPVLHIERVAYSFDAMPVELRHSVVDTRELEYLSDLSQPA